jgi:hypothetical protein
MARNESDREDLFEELASARLRWELAVDGELDPVVAGVRSEGRFSIFFGPDPCYHFDGQGRLKRAFVQGHLYRTQGNTLARLHRRRTPEETQLIRHDLDASELDDFLTTMHDRLRQLDDRLRAGAVTLLRHSPERLDWRELLEQHLAACLTADPPLAEAFRTRRS